MKRPRSVIEQRQQAVIELLKDGIGRSPDELAAYFRVSLATIRRDISTLSDKRLIETRRGRVSMVQYSAGMQTYEEKAPMYNREKQLIAAYVATLVPDRGVIFCNSGTTVLAVLRRCSDKHVTIITNNAIACTELRNGSCELISTGGTYCPATQSYVGDYATILLEKTYANMCILGVNGVSATHGITTYSSREPAVNEHMIRHCRGLRIVVATGHKIGKVHCFTSVPIRDIDVLVTDSSADAEELERIRKLGIEVVCADRL